MGRRTRVSVVIPVKDDADRLAVCLAALARQTEQPFEVVVVDNDSADDSASVARARGARVVFEGRPGIPAASSAGYDAATGDVIARLDADSIAPPHWLGSVRRAFDDSPELGCLTGGATFSGGPAPLRRIGAALYLGAYYLALAPALGHVPVFGSNFAMRRSVWQAIGPHVHRDDTELHDDLDLSFHLRPPVRVRYAGGLAVRISHRPLTDLGSLVTRFGRGFRTVAVHWPAELPWLRWARALRWGARGRRGPLRPRGSRG
ncbi:MAG: glycosyltransferase family 2 protein [Herbiconiux sp.]|nr:glycosyltransferase family 2 protein [Herbiconiux sp.]